ncbi:hypothetical protein MMC30_008206 [Trapelia coarctata]|nr:hypothetical protein [Trapelia coarctata]
MDRSKSAVTDCTWSAASKLPLHEDQTVCAQLLNTIATTPPLQILPSKITGAGSGLFTTKDVEEGEEIFQSEPLVNCVMSSMERLVCDYCYKNHNSGIDPSGRFRTLTDHNPNMKACSGCRACYYCSRTSPKKVRAKLARLQKGSEALDHAYKDALDRINGQLPGHRDLARRALSWIKYA